MFYYAVITDIIGTPQVSMTHFLFHYTHFMSDCNIAHKFINQVYDNSSQIQLFFPWISDPCSQLPFFAYLLDIYICLAQGISNLTNQKLIHHSILSYPKLFHLLISHLTECNHYPRAPFSSLKIGCLPQFFSLSLIPSNIILPSNCHKYVPSFLWLLLQFRQLYFTIDYCSKLLQIIL